MIVLHFCLFNLQVRNSNFSAFIDVFTANTYVMVIVSDSQIPSEAIMINIRNARKHFERLERDAQGTRSIQQVTVKETGWKLGEGAKRF